MDNGSKVTEPMVISDDSVDVSDAVSPNVAMEIVDSAPLIVSDVQNVIESVINSDNSCNTDCVGNTFGVPDNSWPDDLATVFGAVTDWTDVEGHEFERGLRLGLPNSVIDNMINEFQEGVLIHQDLISSVDEGQVRDIPSPGGVALTAGTSEVLMPDNLVDFIIQSTK